MKKQPEVTARTRKKIMDSFWELYKDSRIEKVSVGAITKLAGLNRGTFYEYFTDIYDLLDQLEDEMLENLQCTLDEWHTSHGGDLSTDNEQRLTEFTAYCTKMFAEYDDKLYVLLCQKGDTALQTKIKERMRLHLSRVMGTQFLQERKENLEYLMDFIISAITGLFSCWHEQGKKTGIENLLKIIQILIYNGISGYISQYYI